MKNVENYDIPKIKNRVYTNDTLTAPVKRQSSENWENEQLAKRNRENLYNDVSSGGSGDDFIRNQQTNALNGTYGAGGDAWKSFIEALKRKMQMGMSLTPLEADVLNGDNSRYGNGRIY